MVQPVAYKIHIFGSMQVSKRLDFSALAVAMMCYWVVESLVIV